MITQVMNSEQFGEIIKDFKKGTYGEEAFVFYHSSWDTNSNRILGEITDNFKDSDLNFFVVDCFEDPNMWSAFRPSTSPALVVLTETGPKLQLIPQMINITLDALKKKFVTAD